MKNLLLPVIFFFLIIHTTFAQQPVGNAQIKGTVLDSAAAPLGFVTIALREPGKTDLIKTTYTSDKGTFEIAGVTPKPYEVVIAFMGFKTRIIPVTSLSATNQTADLGKISLAATNQQLQTVEVTAEKLIIKQDIDKIIY